MAIFWLLIKIKNGSETSFWCTFSAWTFHKYAPYLILYQLTKFQCFKLFPSKDIKQNVSLHSYLDNWCGHTLQIYLWSSSKAMANMEKKEGMMEIQKLEYLETEKSFLDEIKSIFHNYLSKGYHLMTKWKNSRHKLQVMDQHEASHNLL